MARFSQQVAELAYDTVKVRGFGSDAPIGVVPRVCKHSALTVARTGKALVMLHTTNADTGHSDLMCPQRSGSALGNPTHLRETVAKSCQGSSSLHGTGIVGAQPILQVPDLLGSVATLDTLSRLAPVPSPVNAALDRVSRQRPYLVANTQRRCRALCLRRLLLSLQAMPLVRPIRIRPAASLALEPHDERCPFQQLTDAGFRCGCYLEL